MQTAHGNLGRSFVNQEPVSHADRPGLWPTVLLVGTSTVLSTVIGVWIGIRGGWHRGSRFDQVVHRVRATRCTRCRTSGSAWCC